MTIKDFKIDEYYRSLKIITYEEIVNMLNNQDSQHIIKFLHDTDWKNHITYYFIEVSYLGDIIRYLLPDQDEKLAWDTLMIMVENSLNPSFSHYQSDWDWGYVCTVGVNQVHAPKKIAKTIIDGSNRTSNTNKEEVSTSHILAKKR